MDISYITDLKHGRLYQAAAPDADIAVLGGGSTLLIEMAAGINALQWVRQGSLKGVLYFGIEDSPECCLEDDVLLSLAQMGRGWTGDIVSGCGAGVSRSSYASCAILMLAKQIDFDHALAMIRNGRPQANPNSGFTEHLKRMQARLLAG